MMRQIITWIEIFLRKLRYLMLIPIFFVIASMLYLMVLMGAKFFHALKLFPIIDEKPYEILSHLIDVIDFSLLCVIGLIIVR